MFHSHVCCALVLCLVCVVCLCVSQPIKMPPVAVPIEGTIDRTILTEEQLHRALTQDEFNKITKMLAEHKAKPPKGMSLENIVELLHQLDNDQKRYEMKLAENREYRERLLRWLLCDKQSDKQQQQQQQQQEHELH